MALPLAGLKVVEFGGELAAAYCGRLLAALGADVVHLATAGDRLLELEGPPPPGHGPPGLASYLHMGKRIVHAGEGGERAILDTWLDAAQVAVIGCDRAEVARLGLEGDAFRGRFPMLASVVITPFGLTGPYQDYRSADLLSFLAFARFSDAGLLGRPPVGYALHSNGFFSGIIAASAALAALRATGRCGAAVQADISLAECILTSPDRAYALFEFAGRALPRPEMHRDAFVLSREGRPVLINTGLGWERTSALLDRPDLKDDPRFVSLSARALHAEEVYALVFDWASRHTVDEISAALNRNRVMGSPLLRPHEVMEDAQYRAREFFEPMALPGAPVAQVPGVPFRIDGVRPRMPAPKAVEDDPWNGRPPGPKASGRPESQPLAGIRVIDLGEIYAGPSACSLLGDLGADVIKVENIQRMPAIVRGDRHPPATAFGYFQSESGDQPWERFHLYHTVERNKRGITLDLKAPRGRELFLELVRTADVVVSNYTPRALKSLDLAPETIMAVNPSVSVVHLPGFGTDGPYADRVSVGPVAEALSGHWVVRGYPDENELQSNQTVWTDVVAAATATVLAVAAVAGGRPRHGYCFDLSQAEALTPFVAADCIDFAWNGAIAGRPADNHPAFAPHGCFPALGDDEWVAIAVRADGEWRSLALAMGRRDLAQDPEVTHATGRKAQERVIDAAISEWTATREKHDIARSLQALGVPCVALLHDDQLGSDPQILARDLLVEIDHPLVGKYRNTATPFRFSGISRAERRPPNLLGQHNEEILRELGCSPDELDALAAAGIIGTRYV